MERGAINVALKQSMVEKYLKLLDTLFGLVAILGALWDLKSHGETSEDVAATYD
jgi:hypothetical protein